MQTIDKDTNPWSGALDQPRIPEQITRELESQTNSPETMPSPQTTPPAVSPDAPATTESPPSVSQVPREREGPVDPQVASLRAMFPDFDDTVLQYVLESVRGDQARAIDTLLGMNDPNYISAETPQPPPVSSQTDLDEQLARRLMLEDQVDQANWQAQQRQPRRRETVPYEARVHQQPPAGGEKDTMTEIQEQIGKFAESGKKTFGNLLSKVKAKMQEFDQPKPSQGSSSGGTEPRWGGTSGGASGGSGGNSYQYESPAQQYSFYDPNPPPSPPAQYVQGYDTTSRQSTPPSTQAQPLPLAAPILEPPASITEETPRPPQTGGGNPSANIDPGKLGLLPKRPVSLLRTQSPTTEAAVKVHDDDDDDLEYAENPFEDHHK